MEVDHPQAGGSGEPPLACIWDNHPGRCEREDEDLVSEPGSPKSSSKDEGETEDEHDLDEPNFLSDDEGPLVHVEISATDQLTTGFQHRAVKAGMLLIAVEVYYPCPNPAFSTAEFGSI